MIERIAIGAVISFALLLIPTCAFAGTKHWYPSGFTVDSTLNSSVAYKVVPSSQTGPCIWCSARHGNYYWKVDFISKNVCSNLYINSSIKDSKGNLVGTWYQKGYYTPALTIKHLEIVTSVQQSNFQLTMITS